MLVRGRRIWRSMALPAFQLALGQAVRERREELGITQEHLAIEAGLHQRWVSNVENGVRNPSLRSLRRLAGGLGLEASELLLRAERHEAGDRAGVRG
jgi:transcriptional regulator with XRE-family HTH domain